MKYKKIHFVGIKGVGMTPLAIIAHEAGGVVTGSDVAETFITDHALQKAGISVFSEFSSEHSSTADLVITTGAHGGFTNPEVSAAREKNIPILTQGQAVGEFMHGEIFGRTFTGVSVAGSHGKTTTTAMIATMLSENKKDPSYIIGTSEIASLPLPGHFGKGQVFVAEADEYATEPIADKTPKFLWQHPRFLVITNIELDHPDIYASVEDVRAAFLSFAKQLPESGVLIVCGDNPQVQLLLKEYSGNMITYGLSPKNDFVLSRVSVSGEQTFFWVENKGATLGQFVLKQSGEHNCLNALAALIVSQELGLSLDECKKGLLAFTGTKRRMELLGSTKDGTIVMDDYAHHPTEIMSTLKAVRLSYPKHRIITIFQPHTYSRTKTLFTEFGKAFFGTDTLLLMDIFGSAREEIDLSISSEKLAHEIKKSFISVVYTPKEKDVLEYLSSQKLTHNTIIITMGAGNVYHLAQKIL
ncbi:UDP-N-acetylmuramate--L-alanine ligase [soil metagenome]